MDSAVFSYTVADSVTAAIMPPDSWLLLCSHLCLVCVSLQVEQLFCLGLRSRSECLKLLEMCDWNLEVASTQMLDNYGSTTRQRCCVLWLCFLNYGS